MRVQLTTNDGAVFFADIDDAIHVDVIEFRKRIFACKGFRNLLNPELPSIGFFKETRMVVLFENEVVQGSLEK